MTMLLLTVGMLAAGHRFTLVIDAGHGGNDHGAPGAISEEKNLTLKYALAFGKMVEQNCPDVKVIYTRKTDVFIPLHERADIANRNNADLFISVHINALDGGHIAHGFQSYTLGRGRRSGDKGLRENQDVAKRENAVIFQESNYKTVYASLNGDAPELDIMGEIIADQNRARSVELSRMMQQEVCKATGRQNGGSHQDNLAVLRLTKMPAVLLELGFISTPDEENYMNTDEALVNYPTGFFNAFVRYKKKYGDGIDVPYRQGMAPTKRRDVAKDVKTTENNAKSKDKDDDDSASDKRITKVVTPSKPKTVVVKQAVDKGKPVFKIQILVSGSKLKANDAQFKGLTGCTFYEEGGYKKYTYGASNNYNEIYRLRKQILDKFPQAFIIAFKNDKKINVNEGIREFKTNR